MWVSKKDIEQLKQYKLEFQGMLEEKFCISPQDAETFVKILEREDFLKIEVPVVMEKPAATLINDSHLLHTELGMTSYKVGNIFINVRLDWRGLMEIVCSSIGTITGLEMSNPLLFWSSVIGCLVSASHMIDWKLNENETAIIIALQQHKKHKGYRLLDEKCFQEANEILETNGYPEMEQQVYFKSVSKLLKYGCVDQVDGYLRLKEKILATYGQK